MSSDKKFERLSVNVPVETDRVVRALAGTQGITVTEAVRRAINLLDLVEREISAGAEMQFVPELITLFATRELAERPITHDPEAGTR